MEKTFLEFIQNNSPDGGFLQSDHWKKFQETTGRKTYNLFAEEDGKTISYANIIEHALPVVGKYFYVPRGPVQVKSEKLKVKSHSLKLKVFFDELISLARKNDASWIRVELADVETLDLIEENLPGNIKIKKSAVDMQPRDILILDISKSEAEILAGMKQKTRYNIKLAEKKGVKIFTSREEKYIEEFLRLVKVTSSRDKITSHPESYYRKMFEAIPPEILKLYVAQYEGKIIAANLVLFFGKTATYMHGASDNEHRSVMAPYLLQWQVILDAKMVGCTRYDLGGVKIPDTKYQIPDTNNWSGITRFKTGFAPDIKSTQFPGSYDIIVKPWKYHLYRILQKIKKAI